MELIAILAILGGACAAFICSVLLCFSRSCRPCPLESVARRLLIVAPHPDDCVLMAAGQAIQTLAAGGVVRIVYVTTGALDDEPEIAAVRRREALRAWDEVGLAAENLEFLEHEGHRGLIDARQIAALVTLLAEGIDRFAPDRMVIPLYEGGHYQHDVTNFAAARASERAQLRPEIWEALCYNFHFSLRTAPQKCLGLLSMLVPGWSHVYPPEPIDTRPVFAAVLNEVDLERKRSMLRCFVSQSPEALVRAGGHPDRLQRFRGYDYRQPPFRYRGSLAWLIDALKRVPGLERVARQFRRTRTIHPDPGVRLTVLPADAVDALLASSPRRAPRLKVG